MQLHEWDRIEPEALNLLLTRQAIHTEAFTIARLQMKKGASVPQHQHINEQVSMVISGRLVFHCSDRDVTVAAGGVFEIPPNEPHGVDVLEDSVVIDLFTPPREDWIRGDDAYLRG